MDKIASELLVERLADWGVDTVFGLPGDGINGIMEGLRRHQDKVRFVLVHHEEAAAFMAAGYAKATGRVGVCLATSGPGGLYLLNGLYDAKLDHAPVLAITGMQETAVLGTGHQQEVQLDRVFMDVAEYNMAITVPASIPSLVDRAMRTSLARRTVSHLTFPNDLQVAPADARRLGPAGGSPASDGFAPGAGACQRRPRGPPRTACGPRPGRSAQVGEGLLVVQAFAFHQRPVCQRPLAGAAATATPTASRDEVAGLAVFSGAGSSPQHGRPAPVPGSH